MTYQPETSGEDTKDKVIYTDPLDVGHPFIHWDRGLAAKDRRFFTMSHLKSQEGATMDNQLAIIVRKDFTGVSRGLEGSTNLQGRTP